jgi:hypothetical protein
MALTGAVAKTGPCLIKGRWKAQGLVGASVEIYVMVQELVEKLEV